MTSDIPSALHVHAREAHILNLPSSVVLITSVTKAVVSVNQSPGISMCDREGSNVNL